MKDENKSKLGKILLLGLGVIVVLWINESMSPMLLIVLGYGFSSYMSNLIFMTIAGVFLFIILAYQLRKTFRDLKRIWFFLGASLTSLAYAGRSLLEITVLYYNNVGYAFPIGIEGYSFPAVYTYKLFSSFFFATFFSVLGYWSEILRKKNNSQWLLRSRYFLFFIY